jgi:carboxyl-terminal processing protease
MQLASNRLAGALTASPDVCLTPVGTLPVPIPYANVALTATAVSFVPNVTLCGGNALNLATILAMSTGDEAGVLHWTIKGPAAFMLGSPTVFFGGLPGVALTSLGTSNTGNAALGVVTIPSATTVFLTYGGDPSSRPVSLEEVARIEQSLAGSAEVVEGALFSSGTGYIAIRCFSSGVPSRVHGLIRKLTARGMSRLILDVRGNPGGELTAFVELASDFLEPGSVIVTTVDGDGDEIVFRARGEHPHRFPLTVLVDAATASAAELFAGCLQAHGRAVVIGERTQGKGVAQKLVPRLDGTGIDCVTAARCRLPDGQEIQGIGLLPDGVCSIRSCSMVFGDGNDDG